MSKDKTTEFTTYGPNRGKSLAIGTYRFVDGVCVVLEKDSSSAARVLCRYHDVCPAHELKEKAAEYDKKYGKSGSKPSKPQPEEPVESEPVGNTEPAEPETSPETSPDAEDAKADDKATGNKAAGSTPKKQGK